eukprot:g249.t1
MLSFENDNPQLLNPCTKTKKPRLAVASHTVLSLAHSVKVWSLVPPKRKKGLLHTQKNGNSNLGPRWARRLVFRHALVCRRVNGSLKEAIFSSLFLLQKNCPAYFVVSLYSRDFRPSIFF